MSYTNGLDKPTDYFNTILWTGASNTAGRSFTGVGFRPDLVWSKIRDDTYHHNWFDSVRGAGSDKEINSDTSGAEGSGDTDGYGFISSFDTDGFTSTPGTASGGRNLEYNQSGNTFVAWNWKANGSGSSNTNGSITSTVSANTTSGFSIVTYSGNSTAGSTFGHGLGVKPSMIITKARTRASMWNVYHKGLTNYTKGIYLNATDAEFDGGAFADGEPNANTFTLSNGTHVNGSGETYVAYCFAEKKGFSKFGSYTGNGNADGTFVYTGFKPAMVICKKSSASGTNWGIIDNKRANSFNEISAMLNPNSSGTEGANNNCDFVSNGFKWRSSDGNSNTSGDTFIYMAFASSPFVTSTGIPTCAR